MKWRTILGVTVGLLLPLPFLLDHCGAWLDKHPVAAFKPRGARLAPIFDPNERSALLTYGRTCHGQKDCDAALACLYFSSRRESVCVGSNCMTDLQCKEGFTCRTLRAAEEGPLVRRCVLVGQRQGGQPCFETTRELDMACGPGLICEGGSCGRPCRLDEPANCPKGFVCKAGPEAPSCQPFCKGGDCPEGQQCVDPGTDVARCTVVQGENCQQRPCSEGQRCFVTSYTPEAEAWTSRMECLRPCDENFSCPNGLTCVVGACRRTCGPDAGDVCGPGQRCAGSGTPDLWLCESSSG